MAVPFLKASLHFPGELSKTTNKTDTKPVSDPNTLIVSTVMSRRLYSND